MSITPITLRSGYTTGSCATAAAKAAATGLVKGIIPDDEEIGTPAGIRLKLKILHKQLFHNWSGCAVQKDAGDDPDVTNGCRVYARVERNDTGLIEIDGGEGVGRVTRPGLQVPVGKAAINPVPQRMIESAVREVIGAGAGVRVVISVPDGKALGEKTFNPRLGIVGGISIIGTTGIVRPMSEDAFRVSLLCGLDIARAMGYETVVLVPGSLGERSVRNLVAIPGDQIVQISNFVGFMLEEALRRQFKRIILAGHPGKLAKLLRGDFHTHSVVSGPANDILLDIIRHMHLPDAVYNALEGSSTVEGIVRVLHDVNVPVMDNVAGMIEDKVLEFCREKQPSVVIETGIILFDMKSSVTGISDGAKKWINSKEIRLSLSDADRG
ncbi:MAG: cobalt-precorrin-5B (C(1))-methyltransferase CbiD [Candidatus Loosdrechtia sp.]|uniref:cobalt-precorrin-5B (C(1))-methyltransferase n=1 Tax=Candidatus Loosdrechtia sp. TaxID=3101272 RepID=UPI003A6C3263|nr:MAG: cobalt-precorrin-5B (C(1))-methyltransferase CbiD [Candidatus Jettenia sp. AMX2]